MPQATPTHATLDEWIEHEAIRFDPDAPASFAAAVDQLLAAVGGSVDILGCGEALHGGAEILMFRNRLFERLVEAHGYRAVALESSFPRAHSVNAYVHGNGPATYANVQEDGFSHGFGRLEANRRLIAWMRQYNADSAHHVKLRFYGVDAPTEMTGTDSPHQVLRFALDYLASVDRAAGEQQRARIAPLLGSEAAWENPAALMDPAESIGLSPAASALRIATEDLITVLQIQRPELIAKDSADRYWEALQHALVARQLLNYHATLAQESDTRISKLLGIRDAMIADNLAYVVAREQDRGKVLVFAHNRHLQYGKVEWQLGSHALAWWPAGAHLKELMGARYAVIGTGVGTSEANGIGQPESGTLEARLTALPGPALFIPTYQGQTLAAAAMATLAVRSDSTRNSTYMPLGPESFTDFDWLAVLDATSYDPGGPPLQQ